MKASIIWLSLAFSAGLFMAHAQSPSTLLPTNAVWKYFVTATRPSGDWFGVAYDDGTWPSGTAELGYGDGDETTPIGFGPDPNNKYITTYFRTKFTVSNPAAYARLMFELVYDDGAVVYLNGSELYRISMPEGLILSNTLALTSSDYMPDVHAVTPMALVAGENVIAVEVHQGMPNSSDISFGIAIKGQIAPTISITNPPANTTLPPATSFTLSADASDADGSVTIVQFYDSNVLLGYAGSAPFSIPVFGLAEGPHMLTAKATDNDGLISTSAPVIVTVTDSGPPTLVAAAPTQTGVEVRFSKSVVQPSATALANYSLSPPLTIFSAQYGVASNVIELGTSALANGATYTLTVNGVRDRAGNVIAPNSQITFQNPGFVSRDIGSPLAPGSSVSVPGGYAVSGAGRDIGGTSDEFQFNYEGTTLLGDFDLRVRVESLSSSDLWAKAGLMARETLDANSKFAAAVNTPSAGGTFFSCRLATGGQSTNLGWGPVTFPNMWLRLKREGSRLTGFMSADGNSWARLGTTNFPGLSAELYVGMAVTSHKATETATAQFRDFSAVTGGTIGNLKLAREPLGPASRRTGLVISEIFYGLLCCGPPSGNDDDDDGTCWYTAEFIEIYNSNPFFENLGGLQLSGNISYRFPEGTTVPGGGFVVLRHADYSGTLTGCQGVRLLDKTGAVLAEVTYTNRPPWPLAERSGHSIVLSRPSYGQNNPKAWSLSDTEGGSPGAPEPVVSRAADTVRINEVTSSSGTNLRDLVELYNHSNDQIDLSGYVISSDTSIVGFAAGTLIAPRGFLVMQTGPNTPAISLLTPDRKHVVDAIWHDGPVERSFGRYPDGGDQLYGLSCASLGQSNCAPWRSQIVINEIMYAPLGGDVNDEYLELYNRGSNGVDVSGWQIASAIEFTFPAGTVIGASNYLVVAKNRERILERYDYLIAGKLLGGYSGDLDDDGERIVLADANGGVMDEVTYGVGGRWGNWSRGGGSSLELEDPHSDGRLADNWADSDESAKGVWTTIEGTASMGETLGFNYPTLHMFLLGPGECLVDDIEVRTNRGASANLVTNADFSAGLSGWFLQGSHDHSVLSEEGGNRSLRLRAATVGDNGPNRVRSSLSAMPSGDVLLRARVKWIRGSPEIALRLQGGGWEVSGRMQVQPNGTPGLRNSRAVDNAGPAITEVSHEPLLPTADENVRVTARVSDPDGVGALTLRFRIEGGATYETVGMVDNGTAGDAITGDGIYTGTVPGQPAGTRVGFYIEAVDNRGAMNTFPQDVFPAPSYDRVFPSDAYNRECIVRWGEISPPGTFGTYHLWLNATNTARWTSRRPVLNDTPLDATFVYDNSRVIYNVRPAYHSSPWHRGQRTSGPDGNQRIDYSVEFPADDRFLGATEALWINPGNPSQDTVSDLTAQAEATANTILKGVGLQNNYQRYVHVFLNGSRRSVSGTRTLIMQDAQRPNADTIKQWAPGDRDGDLLWLEDWYEYPDNGDDFVNNNDADLMRREITNFVSAQSLGGRAFHMGAYRFMFRLAPVRPGESANEYSTLFALLNSVTPTNDGPVRLAVMEPVVDYQQWMRMLAAQHAMGNWDTYGYDRGRNAYMYGSSTGRVQLWAWKNNFTMGIGGHSPGTDVFTTTDPRIMRMWQDATILRAYWRGFYQLITGPLQNSYLDPILDAKLAALRDNGVDIQASQLTFIKSFIRDRRNYLASRLAMVTNVPLSAVGASTNGNVLTLRGTAPIQVQHIWINGQPYPISWTPVSSMGVAPTNWTASVALHPGLNSITIEGYDSDGNPVTPPVTLNAEYTGEVVGPQGHVVIDEIMYRPPQPGAEYIELFNVSSNYGFDLAGWRLEELGFEFPVGSILLPNAFVVLAKNPYLVGAAYASQGPSFAYPGQLALNGQTLSLIAPGSAEAVDRVRYEAQPPWPPAAGSALQLIDPREDNSRVSNWSDGLDWRYVTFTGTIAGSASGLPGTNLYLFLNGPGTVYVDDVTLVKGSVSELGANMLENGGFEVPLAGTWAAVGNHSGSARSTEVSHSGAASLKVVSTGVGSPISHVHEVFPANTTNAVYTLSFWFLPSANGSLLTSRTAAGSEFNFQTPIAPLIGTPGQSNSLPADLPPYDPLWLNELYFGGETSIEIYNAGPHTVSLENYYLTQNYANPSLAGGGFPPGSVIGPHELEVFYPAISPAAGKLALVRKGGSFSQIVDYFNFTPPLYGAVPDGQPFTRGPLRYPSLRLSNLSPRAKSIQRLPGITYLRFEVTPGYRYDLEYKNELNDPVWQSVGGDYLVADGPELEVADTLPGMSRRFYRLSLVNAVQ